MYPLYDNENRLNHNKIAFKILDLDRDNALNIINLLDLQTNLKPNTLIGKEVFKLVEYQMNKNKAKQRSALKVEILNYDVYCKVIGRSCLI